MSWVGKDPQRPSCLTIGSTQGPSKNQLAMLCLKHPRVWLPLLAAWAHCCSLLTWCQPEPPDPFPWGCSPAFHPAVYAYSWGCPVSGAESVICSYWTSQLLIVQPSSLSRSSCKVSLSSTESTASPNLVLFANLFSMHSIPVSRLFIKTLNRTGPQMELWGTPLVTGM